MIDTIKNTSTNNLLVHKEAKKTNFLIKLDRLEFYRLGFLVGMILIQGCILAPFTLFSMHSAGFSDVQLYIVVIASFSILISNLSVQPLRISIPIFIVSAVAQITVILYNVAILIL